MGILNRAEIERRLASGDLICNARKTTDGSFDVQPDSYDLTAGTAIWKSRNREGETNIERIKYDCNLPFDNQPSVTVQPGQMIFVITYEDINMPIDVSGTVYSRNNIALEGILGLNAGHVDPGYLGPIVIRLINLRANSWTLILGSPIFTIVFETLDHKEEDTLVAHPGYSQEKMLKRVMRTADNALSNALVDLCGDEIDRRLHDHYTIVQEKLKSDLAEIFLPKEAVWSYLLKNLWTKVVAGIVFLAAISGIGALIFTAVDYFVKKP